MATVLFVANLAAAVLLLALAARAGWRGRRRSHFVLVPAALLALAAAIVHAERFGRAFALPAQRRFVHLAVACLALALLPGVLCSGLAVARGRRDRSSHGRWVLAFLCLAALAVVTACWMLLRAVRRC